MQTSLLWHDTKSWKVKGKKPDSPDLVLAFISPAMADMHGKFDTLRRIFPTSIVVGCSTGGEIFQGEVSEGGATGTAITFDKTKVKLARALLEAPEQSFETGVSLAQDLAADDLSGVFVLSDGLLVNGSGLIDGLQSVFGTDIPISGGLAGDGPDFGTTYVGANNAMVSGQVAIIGFYGDALKMHSGSFAGWDDFGPERIITKSKDNILYELNGQPALDLYKKYLGEEAADLPGSALIYPLKIYSEDTKEHDIIRTVVGIDEEAKSMIFAGNVPENKRARLMVGNFDNLIAGADTAAKSLANCDPDNSVALLVSCIGRHLLLGSRTYEEADAVKEVLGKMPQVGFYSYGEISAHHVSGRCDLHNQTMTIAVLEERV